MPVGDDRFRVTSTKRRPPASCIGALLVTCHSDRPSGFMGSVIISLVARPTGRRGFSASALAGMGNSVVDRPALDRRRRPRRPGPIRCPAAWPKWASIRRPSSTSSHDLRLRQRGLGLAVRRDGALVRPARWVTRRWRAPSSPIELETTLPSRHLVDVRESRIPETRASPRPKLDSTEATFRLPDTGSAVNNGCRPPADQRSAAPRPPCAPSGGQSRSVER